MEARPPDWSDFYDWTLATIAMWGGNMPKTEVIELCAKNFDFRVLSSAAEKMNEHKSVEKPTDRVAVPQSGESQVLAIRIFDRIQFLIGKKCELLCIFA